MTEVRVLPPSDEHQGKLLLERMDARVNTADRGIRASFRGEKEPIVDLARNGKRADGLGFDRKPPVLLLETPCAPCPPQQGRTLGVVSGAVQPESTRAELRKCRACASLVSLGCVRAVGPIRSVG